MDKFPPKADQPKAGNKNNPITEYYVIIYSIF